MPEELLRRGDLALVRSSNSERAGLYRGEGEELRPAGALDPAEWRWVLWGAAPVALGSFAPEPDGHSGTGPIVDPAQTALDVKA